VAVTLTFWLSVEVAVGLAQTSVAGVVLVVLSRNQITIYRLETIP